MKKDQLGLPWVSINGDVFTNFDKASQKYLFKTVGGGVPEEQSEMFAEFAKHAANNFLPMLDLLRKCAKRFESQYTISYGEKLLLDDINAAISNAEEGLEE